MPGDFAQRVRGIGKRLVPPILIDLARGGAKPRTGAGFEGRFDSYAQASAAAGTGYEDERIIQSTIERTRRIRDSVQAEPTRALNAWTIQNLAAIEMGVRPSGKRALRVLDFGGGMGLHYFTLRPFLAASFDVDWTVCETAATARAGQEHFADGPLRFSSDVDTLSGPFDVALASGALQYVESPPRIFERLSRLSDTLILNRTPFIDGEDRLTVQTAFDGGRYPAWFLSERAWLTRIEQAGFGILLRWTAPDDTVQLDGQPLSYQGLLARRR